MYHVSSRGMTVSDATCNAAKNSLGICRTTWIWMDIGFLGPGFSWKNTFFSKWWFQLFDALCSADYCKLKCPHCPLFVHCSPLVFKILLFCGGKKIGLSSFELVNSAHGTTGVENHPEARGGGHPELQRLQWRPERLSALRPRTELLAESSWQRLLTLVPLLWSKAGCVKREQGRPSPKTHSKWVQQKKKKTGPQGHSFKGNTLF